VRSASSSRTHHPNDHGQDTEAPDVNGGYTRNISFGGAVPGKRRFKLQISRLPTLPFFTAIEFLSMTTSHVVPHHRIHLSDKSRSFRDSA
jgi:hypothetical protein